MGRISDEGAAPQQQGFWRRQFTGEPTRGQEKFDRWFGVAIPVACYFFDPLIFQGLMLDHGLLEEYRLFVYMVSAIEIGMLLCWFTFRRDLETFAAPFAGVLFAGGLFSALIGVLILPLSVLGMLYVIGLLGFIPFVTAVVYLRNGVRAMRAQIVNSAFQMRYLIALAAAFLVIGFPLFWSIYLQDRNPWTFLITF